MRKETLLFWVTVFGGIGGGLGGFAGFAWFVCLVYGIRPEALRGHMNIAWPAWIWLILGATLFVISLGTSIWSLSLNRKARNLAENEVTKWKDECTRAAAANQTAMDNARAAAEQHTAEYVKHVNQEKNQALKELGQKHSLEIAELEKRWEQHAAELVRQGEEKLKLAAQKPPSKLVIHSANYAAVNGKGKTCDVTKFMRQIIVGDCLVHDIESHSFQIGGENFVPKDPCFGEPKRLQVTYSYDGEPETTVERPEHSRIVLPQDTGIDKLSALLKIAESVRDGTLVDGPLFSPLQLEAFRLAKELRTFLEGLGLKPSVDKSKYPVTPEGLEDFVRDSLRTEDPWLNKLQHGYAAQFSARIDNIMHRLAAESLRDFKLEQSAKSVYDDSQVLDIAERIQLLAVKLDFPNDRKALSRES